MFVNLELVILTCPMAGGFVGEEKKSKGIAIFATLILLDFWVYF